MPYSKQEDEDDELKCDKWTSITKHIQNIHGEQSQQCRHRDQTQLLGEKDGLSQVRHFWFYNLLDHIICLFLTLNLVFTCKEKNISL